MSMRRILLPLLFATVLTSHAQPYRASAVFTAQYKVRGEAVDVLGAHPTAGSLRPTVILLPDRFGLGMNVRSFLSVFAGQGFRAYAISLRSAPEQPARDCPDVVLDTTDVERVASIVADIIGEKGSSGSAVLFAMDVGANIGLRTAVRLPLFKAAALVSPINDSLFLHELGDAAIPIYIASGEDDATAVGAAIQSRRDDYLERARRIDAITYKRAGRFFFNSLHAEYSKPAMNLAWNEALRLFRSVLPR
jgi:dienelactone hydrolase